MTADSERPTVAEIAALTRRLRELSDAGIHRDRADVERFLADKRELLDRITATADQTDRRRRDDRSAAAAARDAVAEVALTRAAAGGYTLAGPSARTWHADGQGRPTVEASDAEHLAIRSLLQSGELDTTEPTWINAGDGQSEIVSAVVVHPVDDGDDRVLHEHSTVQNHGSADRVPIEPDTHFLLDPPAEDPWADYRTYTREEAAAELVARGVPAEHAPAVVDRFLDSLQWNGWSAQDQWDIDDDDVDVMLDRSADGRPLGPTDAELDEAHARVQTARDEGGYWQPAETREQRRERDEPGPDGRRWELRDVTDESADTADRYGSTYGTGYDWAAREFDPTADRGLTGAEGPPIPGGPVWSAQDAARELAAEGRSLAHAETLVRSYLDAAADKAGVSVHEWGLEPADLDAIRAEDDGHLKACVDASHQAAARCYGCAPFPAHVGTAEGGPVDRDRVDGCCQPVDQADEDEAGLW